MTSFLCIDCKQPSKGHAMDPVGLEQRCYDCYFKFHQPSLFGAPKDDEEHPQARGYDR